jgi:hypothetical protein
MKRICVSAILIAILASVSHECVNQSGLIGPERDSTEERREQSRATVLQNYYYAQPGKEAEVLNLRLHASDILKKLGVRSGRVLHRLKNRFDITTTEDPDVVWECEFPDEASLKHDVQIVRASEEFDAVQKQMSVVLRNFESRRWEVQTPAGR